MQLPSTEMEEAGQGEDILGESGMVIMEMVFQLLG